MQTVWGRVRKDVSRWQHTLWQESGEWLGRVRAMETVGSWEQRSRQWAKVVEKRFQRWEPTYSQFMADLRRNAEAAGIDIAELESGLRAKAAAVTAHLPWSGGGSPRKAKTAGGAESLLQRIKKRAGVEPKPPARGTTKKKTTKAAPSKKPVTAKKKTSTTTTAAQGAKTTKTTKTKQKKTKATKKSN